MSATVTQGGAQSRVQQTFTTVHTKYTNQQGPLSQGCIHGSTLNGTIRLYITNGPTNGSQYGTIMSEIREGNKTLQKIMKDTEALSKELSAAIQTISLKDYDNDALLRLQDTLDPSLFVIVIACDKTATTALSQLKAEKKYIDGLSKNLLETLTTQNTLIQNFTEKYATLSSKKKETGSWFSFLSSSSTIAVSSSSSFTNNPSSPISTPDIIVKQEDLTAQTSGTLNLTNLIQNDHSSFTQNTQPSQLPPLQQIPPSSASSTIPTSSSSTQQLSSPQQTPSSSSSPLLPPPITIPPNATALVPFSSNRTTPTTPPNMETIQRLSNNNQQQILVPQELTTTFQILTTGWQQQLPMFTLLSNSNWPVVKKKNVIETKTNQ